MFQYQSVPFNRCHINSSPGLIVNWHHDNTTGCVLQRCSHRLESDRPFLKQCHWTEIRHAHGDTDTFQICTWNQLFRLYWSFLCWLACTSQWCKLSSVHLLFRSCLVSDGPLGSSCFCARLKQKLHACSGIKCQRNSSRICGGSGLNSGIKRGTVLMWMTFQNSYSWILLFCFSEVHSTPLQLYLVQYLR